MRSALAIASIAGALAIPIGISCAGLPEGPAPEQATIGSEVYGERCASCHGDTLRGSNLAPALAGAKFRDAYAGKPARTLYNRIITTMPMNDPGTLEPDQVVALTVFIARQNDLNIVAAKPDDLNSLQLGTLKQ